MPHIIPVFRSASPLFIAWSACLLGTILRAGIAAWTGKRIHLVLTLLLLAATVLTALAGG